MDQQIKNSYSLGVSTSKQIVTQEKCHRNNTFYEFSFWPNVFFCDDDEEFRRKFHIDRMKN